MHGDSQIRCRDGDWDKRPPTCSCKSSGFLDLAKSLVCYRRHPSWTLWVSLSLVGETYWKAFPAAIQCPSDHVQLYWAFIEYRNKIWEKLICYGKNKICASIEASFGPLTSLFLNKILQSSVIVMAPNWFRGLAPMESRGHQEAQIISSLSNMSVGAATLSILWISQSPWKKSQIQTEQRLLFRASIRLFILHAAIVFRWYFYMLGESSGIGVKPKYCPNFVAQFLAPCQRFNRPANGWIRGTDFRHGRRVTFGCYGGYQMVGSSSVTCDDGRWRGAIPVCKGEIRR